MATHGMRDEEESGSHIGKILVLVLLFGGYMVYTHTYNPVTAAQHLFTMVQGVLSGNAQHLFRPLRHIISTILDALPLKH